MSRRRLWIALALMLPCAARAQQREIPVQAGISGGIWRSEGELGAACGVQLYETTNCLFYNRGDHEQHLRSGHSDPVGGQ